MAQQSVELAIETTTGQLLEARGLLRLPEADFTAMRREAMQSRLERRRGESSAPYVCAACKHPLYLTRHVRGEGNRWFAHDAGAPITCPYYEGRRLSPEIRRALLYRGQQESAEHQRMKLFIAQALRQDPLATDVRTEQVTFSQVAAGEWRRPDVSCTWAGHRVVFEVQLTYTFLSVVLEREAFYRREGVHIIWVFQQFDRNRAVVTDEAFFNRRNLFVLDTEAARATEDAGVLTFSGWHQVPRRQGTRIEDVWQQKLVALRQVEFPLETLRPFFYDYPAELRTVQQAIKHERAQRSWGALTAQYLETATAAFQVKGAASDYVAGQLRPIVDRMYEHPNWHRGLEALSQVMFQDDLLRRLLSIKAGLPIGFNYDSVFQVIESGLRISLRDRPHAYAVLLLWAYKIWQPPMKDKHKQWMRDYAHEVQRSVLAAEGTYLRYEGFDEAVGALFPEMDPRLCERWATG